MIDNKRIEIVARAIHRHMSPDLPWWEAPDPLPPGIISLFGTAERYRAIARVALDADAEMSAVIHE